MVRRCRSGMRPDQPIPPFDPTPVTVTKPPAIIWRFTMRCFAAALRVRSCHPALYPASCLPRLLEPGANRGNLQGRQSIELTATRLTGLDLPLDWTEQRRLLAS